MAKSRLICQRHIIGLICQRHIIGNHHLTQVDQGVAHAAQRRVDAHVGDVGDVLETHVVEDAHAEHLALLVGQEGDHPVEVGVHLVHNHALLHRCVGNRHVVDVVVVLARRLHRGNAVLLTEMVDDKVMGDAHGKLHETSVVLVALRLDGLDDLHEGILKDIVSQLLVFHEREYVGINLFLVSTNQ